MKRTLPMKYMLFTAALTMALLARLAAPASAAPKVVVSIKPLHSLVAGVMKGVGEPHLLIKGAASPHTFSLKPSDAREIERARVIFWVGELLAPSLERPLEVLPKRAEVVAMTEIKGLKLLKIREGGLWEAHDDHHDEHGHGKAKDDHHDDHKHAKAKDDHHDDHKHGKAKDDHHDEHKHAKGKDDHHDDHKHEKAKDDHHDDHKHGKAKDDHHDEHKHEKAKEDHHDEKAGDHHGHLDAHAWLDPIYAKKWVHEITHELEEVDPANGEKYEANEKRLMARLDALHEELKSALAPLKGAPYIVFHDAYQYFEKRYGLNAIGSVTLSPEIKPGAARLVEIRKKVRDTKSICVFSEPQFQPKLVKVVMEGTGAGTGVLDPLGADIPAGEDAYFTLLRNMAKSLKGCLSRK
ncbi:MAG: zinc ABC transporter substrate-binding protein [Nitrospinae bacterium]|nr:zinc ABC transporter substrate-binding protein [Nitrospinota bacterium]